MLQNLTTLTLNVYSSQTTPAIVTKFGVLLARYKPLLYVKKRNSSLQGVAPTASQNFYQHLEIYHFFNFELV